MHFGSIPDSHDISIKLKERVLGPSCSNSHVPGYIHHPKLRDAGKVVVVTVNDPFVYEVKLTGMPTTF